MGCLGFLSNRSAAGRTGADSKTGIKLVLPLTKRRGHEMNIEIHAPSQIILIVSLGISALALVCYVILAPSAAFWMALMANAIMVLGTLVKT